MGKRLRRLNIYVTIATYIRGWTEPVKPLIYRLVQKYGCNEKTEKGDERLTRVMGRPREFDLERALDHAIEVFWRNGYEGTSISDLTEAMGINPPSLYAAFGNKEQLFRKALERYVEGPACYVKESLAEPTARQVVESLFRGGIEMLTNPKYPSGCFAVQSALACGDEASGVRDELSVRRKTLELALRRRFQEAVKARDLPAKTDAAALAGFVSAVIHGMAVQAAGGAKRKDLKRVAELALKAWPS
jgi:AcrR family transcriptional regulator